MLSDTFCRRVGLASLGGADDDDKDDLRFSCDCTVWLCGIGGCVAGAQIVDSAARCGRSLSSGIAATISTAFRF